MRSPITVLLVMVACVSSCAAPANTGGSAGMEGAAGSAGSSDQGGAGASGEAGSSSAGSAGVSGAAGSGNIVMVQQALSGTRLKAYWNGSADGAKQFAFKWYDSQLQIDCTFNAAVGVGRCLPVDMVSGTPIYSDMTCATAIAVAVLQGSACQVTAPTLAQVSFPDATVCGGYLTKIYGVGATYTGTAFVKSGTNCTSGSSLLQSGYVFYSLGELADLSKYQAVTLAHD